MIDEILQLNREFVAGKGYEAHLTDKYPNKRLAVLSCMDTRLSVLLQVSFHHFEEEMRKRGIADAELQRSAALSSTRLPGN